MVAALIEPRADDLMKRLEQDNSQFNPKLLQKIAKGVEILKNMKPAGVFLGDQTSSKLRYLGEALSRLVESAQFFRSDDVMKGIAALNLASMNIQVSNFSYKQIFPCPDKKEIARFERMEKQFEEVKDLIVRQFSEQLCGDNKVRFPSNRFDQITFSIEQARKTCEETELGNFYKLPDVKEPRDFFPLAKVANL